MNLPVLRADEMTAVSAAANGGSRILTAWRAEREASRALQATPPAAKSQRMYAGAQFNRLTGDWNSLNTSADSEIITSLRMLRSRSRQLIRDNEYAKQAQRVIVNNVIGNGIGLQSMVANARGKLQPKINDQIEQAWADWCDRKICHTAGLLGFADLERVIMGQIFEAGEVLLRKVRLPFGGGNIPFALEIIEADRLIDAFQTAQAPNGNTIRMGVEVDSWGRPVAYWMYPSHPGDYQFRTFQASKFVRVPAEDLIHLYVIDRWPQTRGVPWMHATLKRIHNMGGYEEAEIVAARASANIVGFITSPDPESGDVEFKQRQIDSEPGTWKQLLPGEQFQGFSPNRPNAALEPFMRYMLRSYAAGVGASYESISRDYSQSNYSSSRLALLDDRALYRILQGWVIRTLRMDVHREWLDAAVLAGAINTPDFYTNKRKYIAARYKPRGWSWIDPTKEVAAYKMAVRSGFTTVSDVIADTAGGMDAEDVFKARRNELDLMADMDLIFDTDPAQVDDKGKGQVIEPPEEGDDKPTGAGEAAETDPPSGGDDNSGNN